MEFFLNDPNIQRVSPDQTRFVDLRAEPYPDGKKIRISLELTPFEKRPNIELSLLDSEGVDAGSASIIEPMGWKLELTLHNRKPAPEIGKYTLIASLSYPDLGEVDRREISIETPAPSA